MIKQTLKTPQVSLSYIQHSNQGQPLILIHGGPGLAGYMESLSLLIKEKGMVVDYFQRGTIESPCKGPFTIEAHVKDLHALVKHFSQKEKPILIGHSWGASLALAYAAKHKTSCKKIILIGTGPLNSSVAQKKEQNITLRLSKKERKKIMSLKNKIMGERDTKNKMLLDMAYIKTVFPVYNVSKRSVTLLAIHPRNIETTESSTLHYTKKIEDASFVNWLSQITLPVIGIHGTADPVPQRINAKILKAHLKDYTNISIKHSGHFPWIEPKTRQIFLKALCEQLV